jgi:DNA gyrase subunit A
MVQPTDEVYAITSAGGVIRTRAEEVKQSGRQTMGVRLMNLGAGNNVVALARNAESESVADAVDEETASEDLVAEESETEVSDNEISE